MLDYLKFQIEDIEKAKLKKDEEETLKEEYNILANAEKINNSLSISYGILSGNEELNVIDSISKIMHELSNVENHLKRLRRISN